MKITDKMLEFIGEYIDETMEAYSNQFKFNYPVSPKSHTINDSDRVVIDVYISYYTIESKEQYEDTLHFLVPEDLSSKTFNEFCNHITDTILDYIRSESFSEKVDE